MQTKQRDQIATMSRTNAETIISILYQLLNKFSSVVVSRKCFFNFSTLSGERIQETER